MSDLISHLRQNPHRYDIFQAISLLERAEPDRAGVGTSLGLDEALRLAAHVDFGFASSDIHSISDSKRPGPQLTLSSGTVSLAGAQGPLPIPFTELLIERQRLRDRAGLEFLDIFNQRLLAFLYRGRRKHHIALAGGKLDEAPQVRALDALSGLGRAEGARAPDGQQSWLRHAGLQGAAPRSMASLLALIRDRLAIRFNGRQFVGSWSPLAAPERASLSRRAGCGLGAGAALGNRAWDQEAGIELSTPPLHHDQFMALLPGGRSHRLLGWLAGRHQQRAMRVMLQLSINSPPPSCLSSSALHAPRLGLTSWLGAPEKVQGPRFNLSCEPGDHGN
jgi:type VI secretion system protein ImpH